MPVQYPAVYKRYVSLIRSGDISRTMAPIWEKKGKKGLHHHWSGLPRFSLSLMNTQASSRYKLPFPFSRALIWAQAQPSSSICSGDMSRTMAPITSKMPKMTTPFHGDHVTDFSQNALDERFRYGLVLFYQVSEGYQPSRNTEYKCHFYPCGSIGGLGGTFALKWFFLCDMGIGPVGAEIECESWSYFPSRSRVFSSEGTQKF